MIVVVVPIAWVLASRGRAQWVFAMPFAVLLLGAAPQVTVSGGVSGGQQQPICGPAYQVESLAGAARVEVPAPYGLAVSFTGGGAVGVATAPASRHELTWQAGGLVGLDHRWGELELGAVATRDVARGSPDLRGFPAIDVRVGPRDVLWLEGHLYSPNGPIDAGSVGHVGVGVQVSKWGSVRLGLGDDGIYLAPALALPVGIDLQPYASYATKTTWTLGLGMRWRPGVDRGGGSR